MKFFRNKRNNEPKNQKRIEIKTYFQTPGKPVWSDRSYEKFSEEAYIRNVVAHKCISMIARSAANIQLLLYKTEDGHTEVVSRHPILDLLNRPNPIQNKFEFFEALYSYKLIAGNAYVQAIFPKKDSMISPRELFLLRPDRMTIIAGKSGIPMGYKYKVNGQERVFYVNNINGYSDILHLKNFHPTNDWYGLSSIEAAAYSIDQHNEASKWNEAVLQNGARPSGALVVKGDGTNDGFLSEEQFDRLKSQLQDEFSGVRNAGKPLLLEGGLEWRSMSMTPIEMDLLNIKNSAARDVAMAFGVPSQLLGIPGDNTYSNLAEARLSLWEQTILPIVDNIVNSLNNWLLPMFGVDGMELGYSKDSISALSFKRETLWNMVCQADFISDEEKRELLGINNVSI